MGMSSSPLEYAAKMARASRGAADAGRVGTEAGALLVKRTILAGSPSVLRGVGKAGRKIGVRYVVTKTADGATALVHATGPFQLIERDTRAHLIPRDTAGGRRRYAVIPDVGVRAFANHPGTRGKHPFEKGVAAAAPAIPKVYALAVEAHLRTIF